MHRFPSSSTIRRIRITSLLVILRCMLIPIFLVLFALAVLDVNLDPRLPWLAIALFPAISIITILEIILSSRTHCPLCMTPVLGHRSCNKHSKARSFCGNYKLRVALDVFLRRHFRCPYCNEPSMLAVRKRG